MPDPAGNPLTARERVRYGATVPTLDPAYDSPKVTVYAGDCLDILRELPDASVHAVVTDPPYNLSSISKRWSGENVQNTPAMDTPEGSVWARKARGFMGKEWDGFDTPLAFQAWCQEWAAECLRVLTPGGFLVAFGGTRTFHRLTCGIEDAGFEIRDSIGYGTGGGDAKEAAPSLLAWVYGSGFP